MFCGTNRPRMRAVHDAMKDTDIAWTCNSQRLQEVADDHGTVDGWVVEFADVGCCAEAGG